MFGSASEIFYLLFCGRFSSCWINQMRYDYNRYIFDNGNNLVFCNCLKILIKIFCCCCFIQEMDSKLSEHVMALHSAKKRLVCVEKLYIWVLKRIFYHFFKLTYFLYICQYTQNTLYFLCRKIVVNFDVKIRKCRTLWIP